MLELLLASVAFAGAVCKDGWRSPSEGPGTCSHHGGVAYWEGAIADRQFQAMLDAELRADAEALFWESLATDTYVTLAELESAVSWQGAGYKGGEKGRAYRESLSDGENRALNEYLEILGRGEQPPEGHPGAPIYSDVARMGAFQGMDAKFYDPTWIALRQRVTTLQNKATALDPELRRQGRTPYAQAAYNTLKARGIDPDDPLIEIRGTPAYDAIKMVDTLPRTRDGYPLSETGPAYSAAQDYIESRRKAGVYVDIPDLIEQVRKVASSEDEAIRASAQAMAWDVIRQREGESSPRDEILTAAQIREAVVERAKSYPKDDAGKPLSGEGPAYAAALTYAEDTFGVGGKSSVDALLYWTRRVAGSEAEAQDAAAYGLALHLYLHRGLR